MDREGVRKQRACRVSWLMFLHPPNPDLHILQSTEVSTVNSPGFRDAERQRGKQIGNYPTRIRVTRPREVTLYRRAWEKIAI